MTIYLDGDDLTANDCGEVYSADLGMGWTFFACCWGACDGG